MSRLITAVLVLGLTCCAFAIQKGSLPDGFYEIHFYGDGHCSSPSNFFYQQLDVCSIDVNDPEYLTTTSCSKTDFKTQAYCWKNCDACGETTTGPIGCLALSGVYSILRTCGPAPDVLHGHTWLLEYKSASGNCSSSILESGVVTNACIPTSFTDSKVLQCIDTTRTEIKYTKCDIFSCDNCTLESKTTEQDVGKCRDSKTYECATV